MHQNFIGDEKHKDQRKYTQTEALECMWWYEIKLWDIPFKTSAQQSYFRITTIFIPWTKWNINAVASWIYQQEMN